MVTLIKNTIYSHLKRALITLSLTVAMPVFAQTITVETERQTVEFGDVVTLNITADFQVITGQLDTSALEDQFEILGTQRSNNIQMVNGNFQSSTSWLIQLLPKQEGELTIPSFKFDGVESKPYPLKVTPIQIQQNGTALKPFFLESTVDETNPYIQQQVIYTLRFYHQGRYADGMLRPPKFDKVMLEPLKEQAVYQKQIQGQTYTVYEWLYALFPQSSGEIDIEPPMFNGRIQYAGQLRSIKEFAKAIKLNVKAEPVANAQQTNHSWLPTKSLTLKSSWKQPNPKEIRVGDTLIETITMNVEGLKINQLPNLTLPAETEYKVYPDKPIDSEQLSVTGVHSVKIFKRSIIPTQTGALTFPEQVIYWWNTETDKLDETVIPAKTFNIKESLAAQQNQDLQSQALTTTPTNTHQQGQTEGPTVWIVLTALLGVLSIALSILFIRKKRQLDILKENKTACELKAETLKEESQKAYSDINTMCKLPPKTLYPALKTWLKTHHQIQHFSDINNPHLHSLILELEANLYNQAALDSQLPQQLAEALKQFEFEVNNQVTTSKPAPLLHSKSPAKSKLATLYKR